LVANSFLKYQPLIEEHLGVCAIKAEGRAESTGPSAAEKFLLAEWILPRQNPLRPRGVVSHERHARPAYVNILGPQTMAYATQASASDGSQGLTRPMTRTPYPGREGCTCHSRVDPPLRKT
jgi:hypothetical protein